VNTTATSFEAPANTNTNGFIAGLPEIKSEIKYAANTVKRTCIIEETQETSLVQVTDRRTTFIRVPSPFSTEYQLLLLFYALQRAADYLGTLNSTTQEKEILLVKSLCDVTPFATFN
jgi:hypothetical protein